MYDITIIGSGPAGANLARLIGHRYKVLLIDKRDLENKYTKDSLNKCCGGLLAPDAQKMLAKLGLSLPKDILATPQLFAVETIDMTNDLNRLYQKFYFNMNREKFDQWLVSMIPDKVDKMFNSYFKSFTKISEGYEIKYMHNNREISAKTKVIIGADGASSRIRALLNKDIPLPEKYIAIQEWYEYHGSSSSFTAIFDEKITDFYSWIIPKDNCILLGSALRPKENTLEKYELLKKKLGNLGFVFDHPIKKESAYIYRPRKASQFYLGEEKIALLGEAAGAISPSSAEGISYALKTSLYLAESLEEGIDNFLSRYKQKSNAIKFNLMGKNLKSPAMYHPIIRKLAMKSNLLSIRRA